MQYFSRNPFSIYILQPYLAAKPIKTKDFPAKYPTPPGGRGTPFETQPNHAATHHKIEPKPTAFPLPQHPIHHNPSRKAAQNHPNAPAHKSPTGSQALT